MRGITACVVQEARCGIEIENSALLGVLCRNQAIMDGLKRDSYGAC